MSAHLCEQCGYVHMSEGALRGQKKVSDPLELELQRVRSPCRGMMLPTCEHELCPRSILQPMLWDGTATI